MGCRRSVVRMTACSKSVARHGDRGPEDGLAVQTEQGRANVLVDQDETPARCRWNAALRTTCASEDRVVIIKTYQPGPGEGPSRTWIRRLRHRRGRRPFPPAADGRSWNPKCGPSSGSVSN